MRRRKRKKLEKKLWNNLQKQAHDPKMNPLLLGWYSLDSVLAHMIVPALDQRIRTGQSFHPDMTADEWDQVLIVIRNAFREYTFKFERELDHDLIKEGLELFTEYYFDLWD